MVFVICCIIAVLALVAFYIYVASDLDMWISGAFITLLLVAPLAFGAVCGVTALFSLIPTTAKTEDGGSDRLQALGVNSSIEGHFFLGSGYVDGKRVLNYITQSEDGGFRVQQADADNSIIYEADTTPRVSYTWWSYSNGWVLPFDMRYATTYRFDVPANSVLQDYTIDNGNG